jgi:hypothetical protein
MSSIKLSELRPAGSELFQDSESFLNELGNQEALDVMGGLYDISVASANSFLQQVSGNLTNVGISQSLVTF